MPNTAISRPFVGPSRGSDVVERLATNIYRARADLLDTEHKALNARCVDFDSHHPYQGMPITIVCISDTHNTCPSQIPPGEILVHAGDLSQYGTFAEIQAQLQWLRTQPHPHKIVIAGNHDLLLDETFVAAHPDRELDRHHNQRRSDLIWDGIHYLQHGYVDLDMADQGRRVRVFGSPWTPKCGNFAFQYDRSACAWTGALPSNVDILVTHGPPKCHLDAGGRGCELLLAELWRARPKVVVCGHIHTGRGKEYLRFDQIQSEYENVILGRKKWPSFLTLCMRYSWLRIRILFGWNVKSTPTTPTTCLMNAAMVGGKADQESRAAISAMI